MKWQSREVANRGLPNHHHTFSWGKRWTWLGHKIHLWRYLKWQPPSFAWLPTTANILTCLPLGGLQISIYQKPWGYIYSGRSGHHHLLKTFTGQRAWEFAQFFPNSLKAVRIHCLNKTPVEPKCLYICILCTPLSQLTAPRRSWISRSSNSPSNLQEIKSCPHFALHQLIIYLFGYGHFCLYPSPPYKKQITFFLIGYQLPHYP